MVILAHCRYPRIRYARTADTLRHPPAPMRPLAEVLRLRCSEVKLRIVLEFRHGVVSFSTRIIQQSIRKSISHSTTSHTQYNTRTHNTFSIQMTHNQRNHAAAHNDTDGHRTHNQPAHHQDTANRRSAHVTSRTWTEGRCPLSSPLSSPK